ncbi:hypothetical protein AnigIFM59636_002956, partial [Aspergillus niger]
MSDIRVHSTVFWDEVANRALSQPDTSECKPIRFQATDGIEHASRPGGKMWS